MSAAIGIAMLPNIGDAEARIVADTTDVSVWQDGNDVSFGCFTISSTPSFTLHGLWRLIICFRRN